MVRLAMGTKSGTTLESIKALDEQIDDVARHPISAAEIKLAKDSILNGFIFNLDSPDKILRERMAYEFYGYPQDYLEKFREGVEKVTEADVARAASKYLHKEKLAILVVGNQAEFDKPLSSLGAVTNIDIAIPPPRAGRRKRQPSRPSRQARGRRPDGEHRPSRRRDVLHQVRIVVVRSAVRPALADTLGDSRRRLWYLPLLPRLSFPQA